MNAERLLANYQRVADAPGAIVRIRRFILDLAVCGKLVSQNPLDEPIATLLKRIKARTSRYETDGVGASIPSGQTSSFPLPRGWIVTTLGVVADVVMGQSPPGNTYNKTGDGVPLINGPVEFSPGPFGITVVNQYTTAPTNFCEQGDLLICVRGSTTGRTNIAGFRACIGRGVAAIRPYFDDAFVRLYIWKSRDSIIGMGRGIAFPSISRKQIENLILPLPPLAEQQRIVAKVHELMTLCDRLEAARTVREATRDRLTASGLARLNARDSDTFQDYAGFLIKALPVLTTRLDQIKRLRQAILNLAVRGKLVPQHPGDEPASELLKRIAEERARPQETRRFRRNGEGDIARVQAESPLPIGWCWTNLDEIALSMRYGTSTKCEYAAPGVPVLRIPNVSGGVVELDDIKFGPLTESEIRDLALCAGDLLMIRSNGSLDIVGRSAVVTAEAAGMAFAGYLVRLRLSLANMKPEMIWLVMNSTDIRDQIERPIRSAVGLKNVNLTEFGALTFPLPPLAEQQRIVAKVKELMSLCDRLEASLAAEDYARSHLLEALLQEALPLGATERDVPLPAHQTA